MKSSDLMQYLRDHNGELTTQEKDKALEVLDSRTTNTAPAERMFKSYSEAVKKGDVDAMNSQGEKLKQSHYLKEDADANASPSTSPSWEKMTSDDVAKYLSEHVGELSESERQSALDALKDKLQVNRTSQQWFNKYSDAVKSGDTEAMSSNWDKVNQYIRP